MSYIGNTVENQNYVPAIDYFNGNGSTVAFTLSRPVASVAAVQAVISNVPQNPGDAFTVSGSTITFTSAPPSGTNNIYVYYTSPNTQVVQPGQGTVYPSSLSTGGPNWDASSNFTVAKTSLTSAAIGHVLLADGGAYHTRSGNYAGLFNRTSSDGEVVQFRRDNVTVGTVSATTTGVTLTGTNGIAFTATQSASSDANTLDDYEEGAWTPSLGGNTTYSTQNGTYTKVGNLVFVRGYITVNTLGTGDVRRVSGLPFIAENPASAGYVAALAVAYYAGSATSVAFATAALSSNQTYFDIHYTTGATTGMTYNGTFFGNSTRIEFSGCYRTV